MAERYTQGFAKLALAFRNLTPAVEKRMLRQGTLAAAVIVRDAARANAEPHTRTGLLEGSIIVKYVPEQSSKSKAVYIVTVRHGKGEVKTIKTTGLDVTTGEKMKYSFKQSADAFYWWWVEFGKHNKHHQAAMPYMRPAFSNNVDNCINKMHDVMEANLPAAVADAKG
jgi:HK97 gp10 family phage protein